MKCLSSLVFTLLIVINVNNVKCDNTLNDECPSNIGVEISYDFSTTLSSTEFQKQQDFLLKHVFQNWKSFNKLMLIAYAGHNDSIGHTDGGFCDLINFIKREEDARDDIRTAIIFISKTPRTDCINNDDVDSFFNRYIQSMLFVIMKKDVYVDDLITVFLKAQFIQWNIDDQYVPVNWEWTFNTTYGCSKNTDYLLNEYPCKSRILIGLDASTNLNSIEFKKQRDFLINNVFIQNWTNFGNLAIVKYSNTTETVKEFGNIINLKQLNNLINQTTQANEKLELCNVFRGLISMYLQNTNIILFVKMSSETDKSLCEFPVQTIRQNVNSILFVTMSNETDTDYLQYLFPYANFLRWNTTTESAPVNWRPVFEAAYGCNQYSFYKQSYPCENTKLLIVFDNLNRLTPSAYKKQLTFLLTNIFIETWSNFNLDLLNYNSHTGSFNFLVNAKMFIRNSLMTYNPTGICDTISTSLENFVIDANVIFFISEFGTEINECYGKLLEYAEAKNVTFIMLTSLVNETQLKATFPTATLIFWDIESEQVTYPPDWEQTFWSAFGCDGRSPLLPPLTTQKPEISLTSVEAKQQPSTFYITTEKRTSTKSTSITLTTTRSIIMTSTHSTDSTTKPPDLTAILAGTFAFIFFVLLIAVIVCFCLYRRRKRDELVDEMAFRGSKRLTNLNSLDHEESRSNDLWRIENRNVKVFINNMLGSGAFANVYLGRIRGDSGIKKVYPNVLALRHLHDCKVAIKILPAYCTDENREDFQQEINFMKTLAYHPHLLCLLGYTSKQIILEFCEHRDLLQYLKRNRTNFSTEEGLKQKDLISFSWQVANGMEYFASLDLTHRDLAARNVLLDKNNVCKIGDFGLARMMDMQTYSNKGGKIPIRWAAIESLKRFEFSTKSDVWSYAVLLYEVFTLGELPYFGRENSEILRYLESNNRLKRPEHATEEIYNLMLSCWSKEPNERPTFTEICQKLTPFLEQQTLHYNYVDAVEEALNEISVHDIFDEIEGDEVVV